MPKLKIDDELDDELDEVEYSEGDFQSYDGEIPPKDTWLRGYVSKMWWTYTNNEDPMLKVLFVADGNTGDEEEYNGCPIWENMALTAGAKFKWGPFFKHFGLTIRMLKKQTIIAEEDDERMGGASPITRIGKILTPGEDSDSARCAVITTVEKYQGKPQPHVGQWLDDEDPDEEAEEEDEEDVDDDDEEELEEEVEEEEEEAPPQARTRRAATGKATARPATKSASSSKTATTKAANTRKNDGTKSTSKAPAKSVSKSAPARGRRSAGKASGGYDEEPPF